jgi:hypothetical protein
MRDPALPPSRTLAAPVCPVTWISIPECSCVRCLEAQVRRFRPPALEAADPLGEIRIRRREVAKRKARGYDFAP